VADFGTFYIVSVFGYDSDNDPVSGSFVRDVTAESGWGAITALPTAAAPGFVTACNFNGQCVGGGVTTSDHPWDDYDLGNVMWSAIGSFDFRPMQDQTAGFTSIPWIRRAEAETKSGQGIVLKVMKLGKTVTVYSNNGKMLLVPFALESLTGFGIRNIPGPGIASGNHVAGDEDAHCFLDTSDELWFASGDGKFEKLGYKEFFEAMTSANIIITYVPQKKRFFISDGVTGYGLTEYGLYSTNQLVTSAGYHEGAFCGFWGDSGDYEIRFETDILDFNQRGMKTLSVLEFGADFYRDLGEIEAMFDDDFIIIDDEDAEILGDPDVDILEASVKFKYNYRGGSFDQTGWKRLNREGIVYPIITATEFKILLRGGGYQNAEASVSYLSARLKMSDKRSIRGLYHAGKTAS